MNATLEHVVKQSVVYGYVLSQSFAVSYPAQDNKLLLETEKIEFGAHSKVVRVLQKKLTSLSYYKDDIDGYYGIFTERAIKKLQKIHNIEITGQTDMYTIKSMIDEEYALHIEQLKKLSDSIKPNQHGEDVQIVQRALQFLGYYEGEIDGINGPLTKKSLQIAEEKHDIQLSEEITKEVMAKLLEIEQYESADHIKKSHTEDLHIQNLKQYSKQLYIGERNENVKKVQKSLQYFGFYNDTIDGSFGPLTQEGIRLAQDSLDIDLGLQSNEEHTQTQVTVNDTEQTEHITPSPETSTEPQSESEQLKKSDDNPEFKQVKHIETKPSHDTDVIEAARSVIGTPYVWGGTSKGGFDCSGFVQFAFQSADQTIPRTVSDVWNFSKPVDTPKVGDLVFFETYQPGPSHMGIYLGNNQFIHAGVSNGVEISNLNESYWQQKYIGAKRVK